MFTSFRQRILSCFIAIICVSVVIIVLTHYHLLARNRILKSTELVESVYVLLLKDIIAQQDFFSHDTRSINYFKTGHSDALQKHQELKDSIRLTIDKAITSFDVLPYSMDSSMYSIERSLKSQSSLFDTIRTLLLKRGYKDYNLEGSMRKHIHWIENKSNIPTDVVLTLRRHEKDYIIRGEAEYVKALNDVAANLLNKFADNDSIRYHLVTYKAQFNALVALDTKIGLKDNTGLKHEFDNYSKHLESALQKTLLETRQNQEILFKRLNRIYFLMITVLVVLSVAVSFIMAGKITKPLTELTEFITRFIDSHFTVEEKAPEVRTKDEIGKLTANFSLLKNEVISHLKFFKQKVDERTAELQNANDRLKSLNEANRRFVPKEFLQFLGKNSIEEITPGDHTSREMTVLFSDIRSFTEISESMSPQSSFDFIASYFKQIVPVITAHNGFVDKFMGDAIMAIFPYSPLDAIRASLQFQDVVDNFNQHLLSKDIPRIVVGTGIHTGHLVLGTLGNSERLETTVISDAVNIASRIEGLTKHYHANIIVSETSLLSAKSNEIKCRYLDEVRVKGKKNSLRIYEILRPGKDVYKIVDIHDYNLAIKCLQNKDVLNAKKTFESLALKNPDDLVLHLMLKRCEKFISEGFPEQWDGIEIMMVK